MTESNTSTSQELESNSRVAILLDVDGVVTNPTEKKVTEEALFGFLESNLESGNKIALNTGRSNEWMIEQVIAPLAERLKNKGALKNFFAVGEKGLTWASFDDEGNLVQGVFDRQGKPQVGFDLSVFLDQETIDHFQRLNAEAQKLINDKYTHSTFFDTTKKAMVSTEMHGGYSQPEYAAEQGQFEAELHELLRREGLEGKFNTDPTTIATDIQIPEAGKHLGARRILDWLASQNSNPQHYIAVGDSSSDLEMADELHTQGKSVDFYYVNPKKPLNVEKPYPIHTTNNEFDNGTIEVFERLAARS